MSPYRQIEPSTLQDEESSHYFPQGRQIVACAAILAAVATASAPPIIPQTLAGVGVLLEDDGCGLPPPLLAILNGIYS
eukprot:13420911-Ditylum_brightwellii.AAC.1